MRLTRRQVAVGGAAVGAAPAAAAAVDPLSDAALYADVKTYAGFGVHRTGTPGEAATTVWLHRQLRAAGYRTQAQAFDFPVFELARAEVTVGGRTLEALPVWTPRTGVANGALSADGGAGRIALVTLPDGTGGGLGPPALGPIEAALKTGPAAVVAITDNRLGEVAVSNALPKIPPWPVPVVIVAGREGPALRAALGQPTRVRLEGRTVTRKVENVVARRPRPGRHLVISTPKSGWLTCAGERGSGVAIWLGLARDLAATTDRNLTLVATTCHEFDGYGGHKFTEQLAPKPAETTFWLHLGANIASYDFGLENGRIVRRSGPPPGRLAPCSASIASKVAAAFRGQPGYETPFDIDRRKPPGEAALFQSLGYSPLLALVSAHPLHHTPRDLPDVTGPELLEPVARALRQVLG